MICLILKKQYKKKRIDYERNENIQIKILKILKEQCENDHNLLNWLIELIKR